MIAFDRRPPKYADVKRETFEKYERKIEAIIKNIDDNSLYQSDKVELKKRLALKLVGQ